MFTLPNGKPIDLDMIEMAMDDSNMGNRYFLNTQTGEVTFFSEFDSSSNAAGEQWEDIEDRGEYIPIERISSHEAYEWMEDFVNEIVEPKDEQVAEKLSVALMGKGAFRRFKDALHSVGDEWVQTWYQWKDDHLYEAMREWLASLPMPITEEFPENHLS